MSSYNIAQTLTDMAAQQPHRRAIVFPAGRTAEGRAKYTQYSFEQLDQLCNQYAQGLSDYGLQLGARTLVMVKPGVDLIALTFAVIKIGAVPVLIDPGMGRKAFLQCVTETEPTAFIGIPLAHAIRKLFPRPFRNIQQTVTVGRRFGWGGITLDSLKTKVARPFEAAPTSTDHEAAVTFTSGSTGIPKGVVYRHGMFKAQIEIFRDEVGIEAGEIDLPGLYIFALFNPALGVTTIIPDMDPRKPAKLNPAYFVEAIQTHGVTTSFGSPTIWRIVADYCLQHGITLPSMRRIFMASAPVPPKLVAHYLETILPNGKVFTPFGATEALPLTMMDGHDLLQVGQQATGAGPLSTSEASEANPEKSFVSLPSPEITIDGARGVCVGRPLAEIEMRIIPISNQPIEQWRDSLALPAGEIGEIVVKGPVVTRRYLNRPEQTALAKIQDQDGQLWHRMGDMGYFDEQGRAWFCGRKSHRVETAQGLMLPVPCEAIFNQHPLVARSALIGLGELGQQQPILIVEPVAGHTPTPTNPAGRKLIEALLALGQAHAHTRPIEQILFHPDFPVDVRHNAKIQREKLVVWARKQR